MCGINIAMCCIVARLIEKQVHVDSDECRDKSFVDKVPFSQFVIKLKDVLIVLKMLI